MINPCKIKKNFGYELVLYFINKTEYVQISL